MAVEGVDVVEGEVVVEAAVEWATQKVARWAGALARTKGGSQAAPVESAIAGRLRFEFAAIGHGMPPHRRASPPEQN